MPRTTPLPPAFAGDPMRRARRIVRCILATTDPALAALGDPPPARTVWRRASHAVDPRFPAAAPRA